MHCWRVLLAAWEPASAVEAGQTLAAGKLFKDTSEAGFGAEGAEADEPDNTPEGGAEWATAEPEEDRVHAVLRLGPLRRRAGGEAEAEEQGGGEQGGEE